MSLVNQAATIISPDKSAKYEDFSKEEINKFLDKIGYVQTTSLATTDYSASRKWICKSCLFGYIIEHLSSGGDFKFQQEIEKCEFEISKQA